jgi:hypothetical protein
MEKKGFPIFTVLYIRIYVFDIAVKIGMTIVHFGETLKNVKMCKHKKTRQRRQDRTRWLKTKDNDRDGKRNTIIGRGQRRGKEKGH